MSSGGGSVPQAPDLSQNISQANQTYGTATSDAAQTMNTAQSYNTNAQNNLSNVTAQSNSMAGQIGAQAGQNMSTYGSSFVPLQQSEATAAQNYGSAANTARLQGQAVAGTNAANQAALTNSQQALAAEGVDPGSVHGAALNRQAAVQGAAQAAGAGTNSAINTQQTAFGMQNTANQLGTQVGQMGTAGAAQAASTGQQGQSGINSTNSSGVNNLTASNSYLNTGVSANNSALTANQDQFGDQMQSYQAQQAANSSMMSSIGSIAGAAAMFMEEGGVVPRGTSGAGQLGAIPAYANGGPVTGAKLPVSAPFSNMSAGGPVSAKGALPRSPIPGSTDTKPAILTPGEFVIPKDVVDFKGQDFFHKLVDSSRQGNNKRRAIPVNHSPHVSMH